MSKILKRAQQGLSKKSSLAIIAVITFAALGAGALTVLADVGTISITSADLVSGSTYKAYGTWEPQGNQCWTPGSGGTFHYFVRVFDDVNTNSQYDSGVDADLTEVIPAACNEDYTSEVAKDNRSLGGNWPAVAASTNGNVAQPDATFDLGGGSHTICAALLHVQPNGQDSVEGVDCLGEDIYIPECGNDILDEGEECDGSAPEHYTCTSQCTLEYVPFCGDGVVNQTSEQCDLSDPQACTTEDGYAGSQSCNMESNNMCTWNSCDPTESCGDGVQNGPEQCDGTDGVGQNQSCSRECTLVSEPFCGDNVVNQESEQCDGTTGVGEHQACTNDCTLESVPYCGDGAVNQTSEQCDGTAGVGANQTCSTQCVLVATPFCGDGIKNGSEQCDGADGVASNQTCTTQCEVQTTATPSPVIALEKLDTPDPVAAGANITYTLNWTVTNASATNVVLTDTIPANTSFVSASTPGVYDANTNVVTWSMGTVATGNYVTTLTVKVVSPLANGTKIDNTATIDSAETNPVNGVAQTTVSSAPILAVEKLVDLQTANPGQTVNYTVKVTNTGIDSANNVTITDTLPSGFISVDSGTGTYTASLGNIAAGATVSTTFAVTVPTTAAAGEALNVVRVNAANHPEISAQVALNVIVPQVLGEQIEVTPKVLGESTELPVTGADALTWTLASMFVASLVGLGVYLKPTTINFRKSKSSK